MRLSIFPAVSTAADHGPRDAIASGGTVLTSQCPECEGWGTLGHSVDKAWRPWDPTDGECPLCDGDGLVDWMEST